MNLRVYVCLLLFNLHPSWSPPQLFNCALKPLLHAQMRALEDSGLSAYDDHQQPLSLSFLTLFCVPHELFSLQMRALEDGGLSAYDDHQQPPPDANQGGPPFLGFWCKVCLFFLSHLCVCRKECAFSTATSK